MFLEIQFGQVRRCEYPIEYSRKTNLFRKAETSIPVGPFGVEQARIFVYSFISNQYVPISGCTTDIGEDLKVELMCRKGHHYNRVAVAMEAVVSAMILKKEEAK